MARKKKKVGKYPAGLILFSMTIALFLVGFCGLLALQSKRLVTYIRENYEVRAFLDKSVSGSTIEKLNQTLAGKPYVAMANDTPQVNFISKEVAAREFIAETKEDFNDFLEDNPLRDSYRIKLREDYFEESKLKAIKTDLEQLDGVADVVYQENIVDSINRNITKIYIVMSVFAIFLLLIIVVLMNNTIRLALYSQRLLIRSMQLVGATNAFITRPFLTRGFTQGLISGIIAAGLVFGVLQLALYNLPELSVLQDPVRLVILMGGIILLGIIIGLLSTFQAVSRYLGVSLDELY